MMRARIVAALVAVVLLVAGPAQAYTYPRAAVREWVHDYVAAGGISATVGRCIVRHFEAVWTFQRFERGATTGDAVYIRKATAFERRCSS